MTRHLSALGVLILLAVVVTLVAPAGAASDGAARRDQARSDRADLAADLEALDASDDELEQALATLGAEVAEQQARLEASRQAVAAAEAELAQARADLAATTGAIAVLKERLVETAVTSFVTPEESRFAAVLQAEDLADVGRKQAFLDHVVTREADVVDELGVAEEDQEAAQQAATSAIQRAEARRVEVEGRLAALASTVADHEAAKAAVEARRTEVLAEIEGLAASEAALGARVARVVSGSGGASRAASSGRSGSGCVWPARGSVTSEYGRRWGRLHAGIDLAGPIGTPIWAAKSGTVIVAGTENGYGKTVVIDHGGGMTTLYAHQSRLAVRRGQQVSQGQLIGSIGNSGNSSGAHLHFETHYSGSPRNPRGCLASS